MDHGDSGMDGYADSLSDPVSGPDGPTPIPTLFTQNSGHPRGIGKPLQRDPVPVAGLKMF
jgi:hypothetical protein